MTDTRAKPAPSGVQAACLRKSGASTGTPLTIHRSGKTPPSAFKARRAAGEGGDVAARPRSTRAPSGGKAIFNCAAATAARFLGTSLRKCRKGGGSEAVRLARIPAGAARNSCPVPSLAKASNRTGAAAWRPARPNTEPLSGRPSQTAIAWALSKPIAVAVGSPGLIGDVPERRVHGRRRARASASDVPRTHRHAPNETRSLSRNWPGIGESATGTSKPG